MPIENLSAALPYSDSTTYPDGTLGKRIQLLLSEIIDVAVPDGSVTLAKLASDSVNGSKVVANSLTTTKYQNNSVTFAKFQQLAAYKIVGNATGSTANAAEITSTAFILGTLLACADAAAVRTAIGLVLGTDVQAQNAILQDFAGLTQAADKLPYFDSSSTAATCDLSAAGRALIASGASKDLVLSTNFQTGTSYTILAADSGKLVDYTNSSAITVTLPATFAVGFNCDWLQGGAGQITFAAASGGTLVNRQSHTKSYGQYAGGSLLVRANSGGSAAQWVLFGDTDD